MRLFPTTLRVPLALLGDSRRMVNSSFQVHNRNMFAATTAKNHVQLSMQAAAGTNIIHLNHAGASPSPASVLDTVMQHLQLEQTMGGYTAAEMVTDQLDNVYQQVAQLLHLPLQLSNHLTTSTALPRPQQHDDDTSSYYNPRHEIALVESATVAWTRLFYSMAQYQHHNHKQRQRHGGGTGPLVILVSEAEYAANVVAACQWAKNHPNDWTVLAIPSSRTSNGYSTGCVDVAVLEQMLQGTYHYRTNNNNNNNTDATVVALDPANIAMVCITHIPTNSGIVNDVETIGRLIAKHNNNTNNYNNNNHLDPDSDVPSCLYLIDACQSAGQRDLDIAQLLCHGLVATGRKFLKGPRGTGFLYVPKTLADQLMPHHMDHFGVPVVRVPSSFSAATTADAATTTAKNNNNNNLAGPIESLLEIRPRSGASRFEFYESNVANKLGLGEAIRHAREDIGMNRVQSTILALAQEMQRRLEKLHSKMIHLHHVSECGIVTFHVANIPSQTIKDMLWQGGDHNDDTVVNNNNNKNIKFETSLVPATSTPLDSAQTSVPDLVRVSLSYTNTVEDIEAFCVRLESILDDLE